MAKEITDEEYAQFCQWRDERRRGVLIESIGKKRTRRGREVTLNEVLYGITLETLTRVENEFNPLVETREPGGNEEVAINVRPQAQHNWVPTPGGVATPPVYDPFVIVDDIAPMPTVRNRE